MDALDLLKREHQTLQDLVENALSFQPSPEVDGLQRSAQFLHTEMKSHFRLKTLIFYPSFHQVRGFRPIIMDSQKRQERLEALIESLEFQLRRNGSVVAVIRELKRELDGYCEHDEKSFFEEARRVMSRSDRERLARHLEAERKPLDWAAA